MRDYPISEVAKNEWKQFALYTIESRAIPNMIDGMKPVQRFVLYSSIKNSKSEYKKVSAIAGVVSGYGYNHGETSAASAAQLMAAEWANNICLIQGRGSFGTRLVQEAAAPRYTYTRLHENFNKYIKDIDQAPVHADPEHEPPAFYVPIIPLVLVNGVKGIGTGFATEILPRDPVGLARACAEYLNTGKIVRRVNVKFPDFKGKVVRDRTEGKFYCHGKYSKKGKTTLLIDEIPYGYDRESYVKILDKLEEDDLIVSYDDNCDKNGFNFEVKLKQNSSANWTDEQIEKNFKLVKPFTENITVIDECGNLKEYDDERELIKDFCEYRNTIIQQRIDARVSETQEAARWLNVKKQFIQAVLDNKIVFKNKKKDAVSEQILKVTDAIEEDCDRLLRINLMSLTQELVKALGEEIAEKKKEIAFWKKTTVKEQFLQDLDSL